MAKIGKNKKRCEKYKLSGHREINKQRKQEKAKARVEHFAARAEAGKKYVYNSDKAKEKLNAFAEGAITDLNYNANLGTWISNYKSNQAKHTEVARWKSHMRKLNNDLARLAAEEKEKETRNKRRGR